ncbi:pH domain-like protein [Moesziomyces antarcticus]|uniref:Related to YRB2 - Ran-GTPase-binding protein involved in nuclear protein export n=2 Tax=Pseudozyma antarctica TaxID=84753 RepID=A0A5C3FRI7_PSEA2|nr:pH domain-like protein [Moesziomyces antarcticus]GAK68088.1 pH domain-like protein [Moesziomyces antarcticus]SPO47048.1 related to YRB2 - Ran-GTPase-binding protein involved in nuclear protein export [Moesziomyces antarcticus]
MSAKDAQTEQPPKADAEQPREPQSQPSSPPSQRSSSPQPKPTESTSREVTAKSPPHHSEDASSSRKREREGSVEPSQMTPSRVAESIPAKKNRLEDSLQEEDDDPSAEQPETEKVGHIREKVHQLSTHELKAAKPETDNKPEDDNAAAAPSPSPSKDNTTSAPAKDADAPTRTQPTFSAFSSKSSPFSAVPSSSGSSSAKSGFSAFAARSSSPLVGSGIKPSSLGSSIGGHHSESASASSSTAASSSSTSAPAKPIVKGSAFGFGAFAGASPLAKPKSPASTASPKEAEQAESSDDKATFEQKLLSEDKGAVAETKAKPLLEVNEDTKTGEEDEETIHSIRAKLYTMADDQSWKERGTGTLRVNVPKHSARDKARLVMRADGVLRVILNVSLFKGMKCELHEKFVRIVAFEDAKPVHYAIKMSNPNNAAALMDVLDEFVLAPDGAGQA